MKRLNRKEVSELVRNFGSARAWAEKYFVKKLQGNNTEVEQQYYDSAYMYWNHIHRDTEMRLAEIGIFIYEDLSERRLAEWDWIEASAKFDRLHYNLRKAMKAHEAEQQEQEESTGAVA